jgi:hypothetical protein
MNRFWLLKAIFSHNLINSKGMSDVDDAEFVGKSGAGRSDDVDLNRAGKSL